jgi:hypothetical protein
LLTHYHLKVRLEAGFVHFRWQPAHINGKISGRRKVPVNQMVLVVLKETPPKIKKQEHTNDHQVHPGVQQRNAAATKTAYSVLEPGCCALTRSSSGVWADAGTYADTAGQHFEVGAVSGSRCVPHWAQELPPQVTQHCVGEACVEKDSWGNDALSKQHV